MTSRRRPSPRGLGTCTLPPAAPRGVIPVFTRPWGAGRSPTVPAAATPTRGRPWEDTGPGHVVTAGNTLPLPGPGCIPENAIAGRMEGSAGSARVQGGWQGAAEAAAQARSPPGPALGVQTWEGAREGPGPPETRVQRELGGPAHFGLSGDRASGPSQGLGEGRTGKAQSCASAGLTQNRFLLRGRRAGAADCVRASAQLPASRACPVSPAAGGLVRDGA